MAVVCTTAGRQWLADKLAGVVSTTQNRIGWGTGAGTAAVGDTALFSESSETRATAGLSSPGSAIYQAAGILTASASRAITNAGLFDAASGGVMLVKGDHPTANLISGDSVSYTMQLLYQAA